MADYSLAAIAELGLKQTGKIAPLLSSLSTTFYAPGEFTYQDITKIPVYGRAAGTNTRWDPVNNNFASANGAITWKSVTFDKRYHATFRVEDFLSGKVDVNTAIEEGVNNMLYDFQADIFSLVTIANVPTVATTAATPADFDDADILAIKTAGDAAKWGTSRSVILDNAYNNSLLKIYSQYNVIGTGDVIRSGSLGNIQGFNIIGTDVPDNGQHLMGFALDRSAIAVGITSIPPVEGALMETAVDNASGLTMTAYEFIDYPTRARMVSVELVAGAVLGTNHIARIISQ